MTTLVGDQIHSRRIGYALISLRMEILHNMPLTSYKKANCAEIVRQEFGLEKKKYRKKIDVYLEGCRLTGREPAIRIVEMKAMKATIAQGRKA